MRPSRTRAPAPAPAPAPLLRFAAAMATRDSRGARRAMRGARAAGWPRAAAEETAFMLVLHAGFPAALEGMLVLQQVWPGLPRAARPRGVGEWRARGERLCRRVYAGAYERLLFNVRALHPDLSELMLEQGYGRVLSRAGLSPGMRERVAVAVLAALGWERQIVSHLLGAVRLGATREEALAAARIGGRAGGSSVRAAFSGARAVAFPGRWRASRASG